MAACAARYTTCSTNMARTVYTVMAKPWNPRSIMSRHRPDARAEVVNSAWPWRTQSRAWLPGASLAHTSTSDSPNQPPMYAGPSRYTFRSTS